MLNVSWFDFATIDRDKAQKYAEILNSLPPETQEAIENLITQKVIEAEECCEIRG